MLRKLCGLSGLRLKVRGSGKFSKWLTLGGSSWYSAAFAAPRQVFGFRELQRSRGFVPWKRCRCRTAIVSKLSTTPKLLPEYYIFPSYSLSTTPKLLLCQETLGVLRQPFHGSGPTPLPGILA